MALSWRDEKPAPAPGSRGQTPGFSAGDGSARAPVTHQESAKSHGPSTMWCPPVMFVGLDAISTINHSDIEVMFTN